MRRAIVMPVVSAALLVGAAAPAAAAPPERETFTLDCGGGLVVDVEVNGNGAFTPGRVVGDTAVILPTSFGDFVFRAVLPDGTVVEGSEPSLDVKGGGNVERRSPRPTVTCTFSERFVLEQDDPEFGLPAGTEVTFSSTVTGFLTGR